MSTEPLSRQQRRLLDFLLSPDFDGRDALVEQARTGRTAGSSCDCGCPSFYVNPDPASPAASANEPVPIDAHGRDPGDNEVGVLLFVRNGYLTEVEIYGQTGSDFVGLPEPDALRISRWSEPDENGAKRLLNP